MATAPTSTALPELQPEDGNREGAAFTPAPTVATDTATSTSSSTTESISEMLLRILSKLTIYQSLPESTNLVLTVRDDVSMIR